MTITGTRGFNEAIITQGGVDVKEINLGSSAYKEGKVNERFAPTTSPESLEEIIKGLL